MKRSLCIKRQRPGETQLQPAAGAWRQLVACQKAHARARLGRASEEFDFRVVPQWLCYGGQIAELNVRQHRAAQLSGFAQHMSARDG